MSITLSTYLASFYDTFKVPNALNRRAMLIEEMSKLEGKNIHCFTCPGTCCTYQANSMQVTPIEAIEALNSLQLELKTNLEIEELLKKLNEVINSYRLEVDFFSGKKSFTEMRRTYTCPFFKQEAKGCGLSRSAKPYGCLGFNPEEPSANGKKCSSNIEILTQRDFEFNSTEQIANENLKKQFNLYWDKKNLPSALKELIQKIYFQNILEK